MCTEDGWRWIVLAAAFFALLINASANYHVGVLNVAILDRFDAGPLTVSWLMSIYASLFALGGKRFNLEKQSLMQYCIAPPSESS
ncbi:hypothetical protein PoB_003380900 [Plakobranchus ocellatus]|uniref:Major facilitator superfamily (MFS) profile domain-containing protein n=1 Tax=Plakobranchus ocellatus TaxID=259542 RepID=A0AAV4AM43_9GAST|nr:hypothetical protein PoB_003380900 [Plakobranchus ocellatus]